MSEQKIQPVDGLGEMPGEVADDPWRDRYLRTAAELDNVLKRMHRDIDRGRRQERARVLKGFIDVVDTFDRALALPVPAAETDQWLAGFQATRQQMIDVLTSLGVRSFESLGHEFNPERHEAIAAIEVPDTEEGIVVEVVQTGYVMDEQDVLRPARVVVSK